MRAVLRMVVSGAPIQMPEEINEVELDVALHGLGSVVSSTHVLTAGLRTRQRIYPTPVDDERVAIFGVNNIMAMPDPDYTREIDEIFFQAFIGRLPARLPDLGEQGLPRAPAARRRRRADRPLPAVGAPVLRWSRGDAPRSRRRARDGRRAGWLTRWIRRAPERCPAGDADGGARSDGS